MLHKMYSLVITDKSLAVHCRLWPQNITEYVYRRQIQLLLLCGSFTATVFSNQQVVLQRSGK